MTTGVCFWTEEPNFDKVKSLVQELGCVEDICKVRRPNSFVWVDRDGIGKYHVQFCPNHNYGPHIKFHYIHYNCTPEVKAQDPMKKALLETYKVLKPVRVTNFAMKEINLDDLVSP